MSEVKGIEKLLSAGPRKRLGIFRKLGTFQLGFSRLGDDDIFLRREGFPPMLLSGIYRSNSQFGETRFYRQRYYIPRNPRTAKQQLQRKKYADGVVAWQGLTDEQKDFYNQLSINRDLSGYNIFLKEYLLSI